MQRLQPTVRFSTSVCPASQPRRGAREVRVGSIRHQDFLAMVTGGSKDPPTATSSAHGQSIQQDATAKLVEDNRRNPTQHPRRMQSENPRPDGWDLDRWLPQLSPSPSLVAWYANDAVKWSEFTRRYRRELERHAELCEQLRRLATEHELVFVHDADEADRNLAAALEEHVRLLECQRRWRAGWVIGGHTWPMRHQLQALGGLWYPAHKVWTLPDQETCNTARRLFPGDF